VVCGSCIYRHVSRIRYEPPFVFLLGDIHSDHPTDLLAFSVIVYLVVRSGVTKIPIPSLVETIIRDATYYFLVIFTSHFVLVMFLAFANVRLSSQSSDPSMWSAYIFTGYNEAIPCPVSDPSTRPLRSFTVFSPQNTHQMVIQTQKCGKE
jgi:hypothetical protein